MRGNFALNSHSSWSLMAQVRAARRLVEDNRKNRRATTALANALGLRPWARMVLNVNGRDVALDAVASMWEPPRMAGAASSL